MNEQNKQLSIAAYYLSKFDMNAVEALSFKTRMDAITNLSRLLGNGNNYLKLRRDEFDVLTGSARKGYRNRKPASSVLDYHNALRDISFDDLTKIVRQLIAHKDKIFQGTNMSQQLHDFSEADIEAWLNAKDDGATRRKRINETLARIYDRDIINNLKVLYHHKCQICQYSATEFGVSIAEAHHIIPFAESENNNANNIIILCPNHHRLLHKAPAEFDRNNEVFVFSGGMKLHLQLNMHL